MSNVVSLQRNVRRFSRINRYAKLTARERLRNSPGERRRTEAWKSNSTLRSELWVSHQRSYANSELASERTKILSFMPPCLGIGLHE